MSLLIKGGIIYDGTGSDPYEGCLLLGDTGRILAVGDDVPAPEATKVLDVHGLAISPGFIDIHSHSDLTVLKNPRLESKIRQGITTEVIGNCGLTPAPVVPGRRDSLFDYLVNTVAISDEEKETWTWPTMAAFARDAVSRGASCNLVALVGEGTIRVGVMGFEPRPANGDEARMMASLLHRELAEGTLGLSAGLQYPPNSFSDMVEHIALCKILADNGSIYAVHMRDEGRGLLDSVKEVITIAERAGVSLQISHFKVAGKSNRRLLDKAIEHIEEARRRGIDVTCDQYPYTAYGSNLIDCLPPWLVGKGAREFVPALQSPELRERVAAEMRSRDRAWISPADEAGWNGIRVASVRYEANRDVAGKSISQISAMRGLPEEETAISLVVEENAGVKITCLAMAEEDIRTIMPLPYVMIGSDGRAVAPYGEYAATHPHPRYYGAFPRVLGHYSRDEKALSLKEAVRKMTSMPAGRLGLRSRGVIMAGNWGDITVFDPDTVLDLATFEKPHTYPAGIHYVFVNGAPVIWEGEHTGNLPGQFVTREDDSGTI